MTTRDDESVAGNYGRILSSQAHALWSLGCQEHDANVHYSHASFLPICADEPVKSPSGWCQAFSLSPGHFGRQSIGTSDARTLGVGVLCNASSCLRSTLLSNHDAQIAFYHSVVWAVYASTVPKMILTPMEYGWRFFRRRMGHSR